MFSLFCSDFRVVFRCVFLHLDFFKKMGVPTKSCTRHREAMERAKQELASMQEEIAEKLDSTRKASRELYTTYVQLNTDVQIIHDKVPWLKDSIQ